MNSNESTSVHACSCNFTNMEKSCLLCHMSGFIFRFAVFWIKRRMKKSAYMLEQRRFIVGKHSYMTKKHFIVVTVSKCCLKWIVL